MTVTNDIEDEIWNCFALVAAADAILDDAIHDGGDQGERIGYARRVLDQLQANLKNAAHLADQASIGRLG